MTHKITYISYDNNDQELRNRSASILSNFFIDNEYQIVNDFKGVLFIASGGSEQFAAELTSKHNNIILLCHRENNSFAATIEIAAYLRAKNKNVSIIDLMIPDAFKEFEEVYKINQAIESLSKQKAAIIGEVSNWLIISDIENTIIKEKLGIELLRLPWNKLEDYRIKEPSKEFNTFFPDIDKEKLLETSKVYHLLDNVITENALSAISVECFSMVRRDQVTACLPLAVFNTKNIVAACEGDVCSMIGSMIVRALCGKIPWQANIAEIRDETVLFAHCTAPLNSLSSYNITTHFETNCGTAIQGKFKKGRVGVFRINNKLDKYMLLEVEISETPNHNFACRTQIEFSTSEEQTLLLKNSSLGNHHLIFSATCVPLVVRMMSQLQIERVVEKQITV